MHRSYLLHSLQLLRALMCTIASLDSLSIRKIHSSIIRKSLKLMNSHPSDIMVDLMELVAMVLVHNEVEAGTNTAEDPARAGQRAHAPTNHVPEHLPGATNIELHWTGKTHYLFMFQRIESSNLID